VKVAPKRFNISAWVAVIILLSGIALASFSPKPIAHLFLYGSALLSIFGAGLFLLLPRIAFAHLKSPFKKYPVQTLFLGQLLFILVSFLFFYGIETHTRLNMRLSPLETGFWLSSLQTHPFLLGFLPWVTFSVLGLGLSFGATNLQRSFFLPKFIVENLDHPIPQFIYHYLSVVIHAVTFGPVLILSGFIFMTVAETANGLLGFDSLFQYPLRSTLIWGFILFAFYKTTHKLINWMVKQDFSLGRMLIVFYTLFCFFLVWLHGVGLNLALGPLAPHLTQPVNKSALLSLLTPESREIRLSLMIWGWWGIWTPTIGSLIAKLSLNRTVWKAFVVSLIVPAIIFLGLLPHITPQQYELLSVHLHETTLQCAMALGGIILIGTLWGRASSLYDLTFGYLSDLHPTRGRDLTKWMSIFIMWFNCYIAGYFLLGWLPAQAIMTIGGGFITTLLFFFIVSLVSSKALLGVVKKYKVPV